MQKQGGNFLLQALLALTLVFAFMPFFANMASSRDNDAKMYSATEQIETAYTAARIYVIEEKDSLPYKKIILSKEKFVDTLENYGLPLGFIPQTIFKQDISLVIDKNPDGVFAYINVNGGNLSKVQTAELARRIGFYAAIVDGNIEVSIPIDTMYSDIVSKKETGNDVGFLSELDMDGFGIEKIGVLFSRNASFETAQFNNLTLYGSEISRKDKNKISDLFAGKSVFQSSDGGAALVISGSDLNVGDIYLRSIAKYGNTSSFESNTAAVYDFSMAEGKTGFNGPTNWLVRGSLLADNFAFTVERLDINGYLDASRGQDVFIDPESLQYSSKSGVDVKNIVATNITLRDQTSYGLLHGQGGAALIDIRPAGTSLLPDVYVDDIDNDAFVIIADPKDTDGKTVSCKEIIELDDGNYNKKSLAQNLICQYVFWQRLEQRIDIKRCLMDGKSDCM